MKRIPLAAILHAQDFTGLIRRDTVPHKRSEGMVMVNVKQELTLHQPVTYQIKVPGELDESWSDWIGGMTIMQRPPVADAVAFAERTRHRLPDSSWR